MTDIPHLRTPDDRFADLPGYPWTPRYTSAGTRAWHCGGAGVV
jgi:hypothetical protein